MIMPIATLTLRQLIGQRRTILVVLLGLLPVLVAVLGRILDDPGADRVSTGASMLGEMAVHLVLPLTALIFGTAALGQEFEEGTVLYLVARPVRRWRIIAGKLLATWGATLMVTLLSAVGIAVALLFGEPGGTRIFAGFAVALALGGLAYLSLFVCLSILFNRALIIGLVYVFVWEAAITALAPGTRVVSIREYTLGIADAVADAPPAILDADLGPVEAFGLLAVVTVLALFYATRALARYQFTSAT